MRKIICLLSFTIFTFSLLQAQQLYLEGYLGRNRTGFGNAPYQNNPTGYFTAGGRIAAGADHFQLGAEYQQNLSNPSWDITDLGDNKIGSEEFETSYYGLFLRTKLSKYPAHRFGLVFRAGAALYSTTNKSTVAGLSQSRSYKLTPGVNGGIGVAIPLLRSTMLELGYNYHIVNYDAHNTLPELAGSFHSIQAGLSLNFVFGERAQEYKRIRNR